MTLDGGAWDLTVSPSGSDLQVTLKGHGRTIVTWMSLRKYRLMPRSTCVQVAANVVQASYLGLNVGLLARLIREECERVVGGVAT